MSEAFLISEYYDASTARVTMVQDEMTATGSMEGNVPVKSLKTTFEVIDALQELGQSGVTELANHIGLSKSSIHKHLNTLAAYDYVVKEGEEYRLGFRFLDIGGHARTQFPGTNIIKPKVQELAEETNEVAQYMTEECGRAVVLFREADQSGVSSRTRVGTRMYLHQIASGKAILAKLSRSRVIEILDRHGLPRATDNTITDREELFAELDEIREQGISYSYGESTKGLYAVAVPMSAPNGSVLGACVVSGPSHRMRGEPMEKEIPNLLLSVVNEIELNIRHS